MILYGLQKLSLAHIVWEVRDGLQKSSSAYIVLEVKALYMTLYGVQRLSLADSLGSKSTIHDTLWSTEVVLS